MDRIAAWALALMFSLLLAEASAATPDGRVVVHDANNVIAAKYTRSGTARRIFRAHHPCPATGRHRGACPGYVIDHVTPLCAGGEDSPHNMQWQTIEEGKTKDRVERQQCSRWR